MPSLYGGSLLTYKSEKKPTTTKAIRANRTATIGVSLSSKPSFAREGAASTAGLLSVSALLGRPAVSVLGLSTEGCGAGSIVSGDSSASVSRAIARLACLLTSSSSSSITCCNAGSTCSACLTILASASTAYSRVSASESRSDSRRAGMASAASGPICRSVLAANLPRRRL